MQRRREGQCYAAIEGRKQLLAKSCESPELGTSTQGLKEESRKSLFSQCSPRGGPAPQVGQGELPPRGLRVWGPGPGELRWHPCLRGLLRQKGVKG